MSYPQLPGRSPVNRPRSVSAAVVGPLVALAAVLAVGGWYVLPLSRPEATGTPAPPAAPAPIDRSIENRGVAQALALAHAEQQLLAAQEQLVIARRVLSTLSPQLSRTYLLSEKRRADAAWTACDAAQRSIEQAIDDIRTAKHKE